MFKSFIIMLLQDVAVGDVTVPRATPNDLDTRGNRKGLEVIAVALPPDANLTTT